MAVSTAPPNGAMERTAFPRLLWNAVSGADAYQVQISLAANMSAPFYDQEVPINYLEVGLPFGETVYWRVRERDGAVFGSYSEIRSIVTGDLDPVPVEDHAVQAAGLLLAQFRKGT